MPGAPLELHEREEIFRALVEDLQAGWAAIGRRVGRHPTTVAREINAGGGRERYGPAAAQRRAEVARRRARRRRLEAPGPLRDRICAELRRGRSPAAIRADLAAEGVEAPPCVETVYQALYSGALDVKPAECLRSRRRRRRCRQQRNPRSRPCGPNIAARPAAVNERAEAGHWEVDQIIGAYNRSSMIWLTERQSRYLIPITMPDGYDRRRRPRRPHRGPRHRPGAPAPQPDLRLRVRMGELAPPRRPLRPTGVVLRPALAVATRPDREPEPPSALVVPTGHRPPPRHPRPSPTRRCHHQPPAPPQPPPPKPSRTLCCPHRAVTDGTGQPELLAYFDTGLTNGPTEGINRIIKAVKRQGFGYTNTDNYRIRVLYRCA